MKTHAVDGSVHLKDPLTLQVSGPEGGGLISVRWISPGGFGWRRAAVPQVPDASHAVLSSGVHPASVLVEAHGGDVLADSVVVDDGVWVVGVQVVHADVLVSCRKRRNSPWNTAEPSEKRLQRTDLRRRSCFCPESLQGNSLAGGTS